MTPTDRKRLLELHAAVRVPTNGRGMYLNDNTENFLWAALAAARKELGL